MSWSHNDLAADLARHLQHPRRLSWTDMQIGPAGSPRPDVYTLQKSYQSPNPTAYEVKISRADFLSDVTAAKWAKYLKFAQGVTFAAPRGLLSKKEIPTKAGLIVRSEHGWRTVKRPKLEPCELPRDAMMKLIIDGATRVFAERIEPRTASEWHTAEAVRRKFGDRVAEVVRDVSGAEERMRFARERAAKVVEDAREEAVMIKSEARSDFQSLCEEIAEAFGVKDWKDLDAWGMRAEVRRRAQLLNVDQENRRLRKIIRKLAATLEDGVNQLLEGFPEAEDDIAEWQAIPTLSEWAEKRRNRKTSIRRR